MNRRGFIGRIFGAAVAVPLAKSLPSSPPRTVSYVPIRPPGTVMMWSTTAESGGWGPVTVQSSQALTNWTLNSTSVDSWKYDPSEYGDDE